MFKIKSKSNWGFMDAQGNETVVPKYLSVCEFREGLASVIVTDEADESILKMGFINPKGEFVIEPRFSGFGISEFDSIYFEQGVAPVPGGSKQWRFIDTSGEFIHSNSFDYAYSFSESLALVKKNNSWGYVNRECELVLNCQYGEPYFFGNSARFSHGLALIHLKNSEFFNYINQTGDEVFDVRLTAGTVFEEGVAMIRTEDSMIYYWTINTEGDVLFDRSSSMCSVFSEGVMAFYDDESELWGFINKSGDWLIKPQFAEASKFVGGMASVRCPKTRLCGFVDIDGNYLIAPKFSKALSFNDGLAIVYERGERWGYVNTQGEFVWKCLA